jgi:tRNA-2-methylthio-N6-dimethylallyladenosine synthase
MPSAKNFFIKTFGCQMNVYDSDKMKDIFISHNVQPTDDYLNADFVVLNTCHIREKATEKTFSDLGRINKKGKKDQKVIVAGCVAQAEGELIQKRAPYVDLVIGPQSIQSLDHFLEQNDLSKTSITEFDVIEKFDTLNQIKRNHNSKSAFVTIQEGCDKFCHFCVVPYTRGSEYSRTVYEIEDEVKSLVDLGVVEFTLLGQNVNAFHGQDASGQSHSLASLINSVSQINGVERITYSTSHPVNMTDDLIELHGSNNKLMPFLHLPVQSGSDRILKLMNRKHTRDFYFDIIEKVRKVKPDIALSSDFIIGFPGETEKDFEDTIDLIRRIKYMNSYSFKYSPRPGTPAANKQEIDEDILDERLAQTQELLNEQQMEYNKNFISKTVKVLIDGAGKHEGQIKGKSEFNQSVALEGEANNIGQIIPVQIKDVKIHSLIGERA